MSSSRGGIDGGVLGPFVRLVRDPMFKMGILFGVGSLVFYTMTEQTFAVVVGLALTFSGVAQGMLAAFSGEGDYVARERDLTAERSEAVNEEQQADLDRQLVEVGPSARFDQERRNASATSAVTYFVGVGVVVAVLVIGFRELGEQAQVTTPEAFARAAVVAAAFYLAGQLFRRSTILNVRAQEFRRGAIALASLDTLTEKISDPKIADALRVKVYEHHLTGKTSDVEPNDVVEGDATLKVLEQINKLRGGG